MTGYTGFESFVVALSDELLAYTISTEPNQAIVRVIDANSLERRYEIPLDHNPSRAVRLDAERFALALRPFRGETESEGKLLVVETATGRVLRETPLGFRNGQDAYVVTHQDVLFTSTQAPRGQSREDAKWVLACWDTVTSCDG